LVGCSISGGGGVTLLTAHFGGFWWWRTLNVFCVFETAIVMVRSLMKKYLIDCCYINIGVFCQWLGIGVTVVW